MGKKWLKLKYSRKAHICNIRVLRVYKVVGLRPATLFKKKLWHLCFPVNFEKFLRTPFFIKHLWWLLLYFQKKLCTFLERNEYSPYNINRRYVLVYVFFVNNPTRMRKIFVVTQIIVSTSCAVFISNIVKFTKEATRGVLDKSCS